MPVGNINVALERGLVDAAFTWEPFVSDALLRGNSRLLLDLNQKIPHYPAYVVMAVPRTLAQRPDDVVRVLRAHHRAIAFLQEHADESNRLIAEAFQIAPIKAASGKTIPFQVVARRPGDIAKCYADPAKARDELGWTAERDIAQMCADSWRYQTTSKQ